MVDFANRRTSNNVEEIRRPRGETRPSIAGFLDHLRGITQTQEPEDLEADDFHMPNRDDPITWDRNQAVILGRRIPQPSVLDRAVHVMTEGIIRGANEREMRRRRQ